MWTKLTNDGFLMRILYDLKTNFIDKHKYIIKLISGNKVIIFKGVIIMKYCGEVNSFF